MLVRAQPDNIDRGGGERHLSSIDEKWEISHKFGKIGPEKSKLVRFMKNINKRQNKDLILIKIPNKHNIDGFKQDLFNIFDLYIFFRSCMFRC